MPVFLKPKLDEGGSSGAHNQRCFVLGQFLRFPIVCGAVDVDKVCENGMNYKALTHSRIEVAFMTYSDVRATVFTVLAMARHLEKGLLHA